MVEMNAGEGERKGKGKTEIDRKKTIHQMMASYVLRAFM